MELSAKEIESAKFTFSIYDFAGVNTVDAFYLGPALRALGLTPSLEVIQSLGGTKTKREKVLSVEEFLSIYSDAKKNKDMGTIDDFVECLRSNDKDGGGTISSDQLGHILQAYGEKLDSDEVEEIIRECGNTQDGFIAYVPFLKHLLDGEVREKAEVKVNGDIETCGTTDLEVDEAVVAPSKPKAKPKIKRTISEDNDGAASLNSAEKISSLSLKTPSKTRVPTVSEEPKAAEKVAAALKPKNQQALISMKTMAMIGSIK